MITDLYYDRRRACWASPLPGSGSTAYAAWDPNESRWLLASEDHASGKLREGECSSRNTVRQALAAAAHLAVEPAESRPVFSPAGVFVGGVRAVHLPRFCVETPTGDIWLRVDAIFGFSPTQVTVAAEPGDLDRYRTEVDRPSTRGRSVLCGWCQDPLRIAAFPPAFALCTTCAQRDDVESFPFGNLVAARE